LNRALQLWIKSNEALIHGDKSMNIPTRNSAVVKMKFDSLQTSYQAMITHATKIIQLIKQNPDVDDQLLKLHLDDLLAQESGFLTKMDDIVNQYDHEAEEKVANLIHTEMTLMIISLMVLLFELMFIFTPIARHIKKIIADLIDSETKEKKMNKELRRLYDSLDQSQKELNELYYAVDKAIMFARVNLDGDIVFISEKFIQQVGEKKLEESRNLFKLLISEQFSSENLGRILQDTRKGVLWKGELETLDGKGEKSWLMITTVPVPNDKGQIDQFMLVAVDINDRKTAEEQLRKATRAKYKRQVEEQKVKSSLILEGQEKERRRIAREIHDGIGQLLTGLRFQLESLNVKQPEKTQEKIEKVKEITGNIIREVRRVSYNLTPAVLNDYGFVTAVNTITKDLNGITNTNIQFQNITNYDERLDKKVEVNLFRIIQEAISNALKYAKASNITVSLAHDDYKLIMLIEDDGCGFELLDVPVQDYENINGRGIFNMKERASLINASLEIDTKLNKGTTIKLEIPLNKNL
ncbi:MAG TPA: PAS domain-containing sensor histidine kinase, partial [Sunxiuqinia sp.]|nr:PAS domain-containing sensor histidine kinase [Sunxiuqinia sp.]